LLKSNLHFYSASTMSLLR